jgi:hypothetical protein
VEYTDAESTDEDDEEYEPQKSNSNDDKMNENNDVKGEGSNVSGEGSNCDHTGKGGDCCSSLESKGNDHSNSLDSNHLSILSPAVAKKARQKEKGLVDTNNYEVNMGVFTLKFLMVGWCVQNKSLVSPDPQSIYTFQLVVLIATPMVADSLSGKREQLVQQLLTVSKYRYE